MPVAGRVGEGVGNGFARTQPLHQRGCVVQGVGIGAVGVEGQAAVGSGFTCFWGKGHRIVQVRVLRLGQGSRCADLRIFGNGSGCGGDSGCIVGPADGHGQGIGGRTAVPVADRIGERIGGGFPGSELAHIRRGVVEGIGIGTVGVQVQAAVGSRFICFGDEAYGVAQIRILRLGQGTRCADLRIFGNGSGCGSDGRYVVCSADGHGQGIGSGSAVPVADRVGEGVGNGFPGSEPLYQRGRVVQGIGVGAVGVQVQAAVGSRFICFGDEGYGVVQIRILRQGEGT